MCGKLQGFQPIRTAEREGGTSCTETVDLIGHIHYNLPIQSVSGGVYHTSGERFLV
jgi:hypothetical protein